MGNYIITVDQSTSATKVLLVNSSGQIVCKKSHLHHQFYPYPDWVEQDGNEIFENTVLGIKEVLKESRIRPTDVLALGITNQTAAFVLWDSESGEPVYPVVGWQGGRGQDMIAHMSEQQKNFFRKAAGADPSPFMPAVKLKWLFEQRPDLHARAEKGEILFGSIDSWLIWKLTAGKVHGIDHGNASITQMFDIYRQQWSEEILKFVGISKASLPRPIDSDGDFGKVHIEGLPQIPITGVIGDSNGALFGQCGFKTGNMKVTYGTGASLLVNMGHLPIAARNGMLPVLAWKRKGIPTYVLEGTAVSAGASINWMIEELHLIKNAKETQELAESISCTEGVYFVSAFSGMGTPYWSTEARACIVGMGVRTRKEHIVRAALEGIAYQVKDMVEASECKAGMSDYILADGGMTKNRFLMQFQADITQKKVVRNSIEESSALGAAYMAGLAVGMWKDEDELKGLCGEKETFTPELSQIQVSSLYRGWKEAVKKSF